MNRWRDSLRHAFAVEKPEDFQPSEAQAAVAEKICRWVVRRRMTTFALITLEAHRGLNFLGSQAMRFFQPAVDALTDARDFGLFAEFMEHRGSIDWLCRRIDELEEECEASEREGDAANERKPSESNGHAPLPWYEGTRASVLPFGGFIRSRQQDAKERDEQDQS